MSYHLARMLQLEFWVMDSLLLALIVLSVLGSGLMAGVFFAFSSFIMRALELLHPTQGIAAMQSINRTVINPWFLGVFFGTAAACLLLGISAVLRWEQPGAALLLVGGLLYLVGTFLVTVVFNVPMNESLAKVEPTSADAGGAWTGYLARWTAWNHVRTVAALLAAVSYTLAL